MRDCTFVVYTVSLLIAKNLYFLVFQNRVLFLDVQKRKNILDIKSKPNIGMLTPTELANDPVFRVRLGLGLG